MTKAGDNAAAFAARFGVTAKALRVYERAGLMRPARSEAGWRAYGRDEESRLTAILALKRLGLPLKRVAEIMAGFAGDLDQVLAIQEQALALRQAELTAALAIVRTARTRIAKGDALSADDLAQLARETAMTDLKWTPELEALAQKHYTKEQRDSLDDRNFSHFDQAEITAQWAEIFADGERLRHGDPASPDAQVWAARWKAQVEKFTQGRDDLLKSASGFMADLRANPKTSHQAPGSAEVWAFAAQAMKILAEGK